MGRGGLIAEIVGSQENLFEKNSLELLGCCATCSGVYCITWK